jgi:DNA repair photolyase
MARAEYREEPCRGALNRVRGMPFEWSLNPYTGCAHRCTFCYVREFERRADRPSDGRYGMSIRVKVNVAEVLRRELARPSWTRALVVVGAATDPYQPAEGRYRLTRSCLEAFTERSNPFGIITRGPLIVRDLDVLVTAAARAKVSLHVSVPTLDDALWRATEPGTAPPRQRLRAVRMLADAGLRVCVSLAPIIPGLSDAPAAMAEVVRAARDAGADSLWTSLLYLKPGTREHFLAELERVWPGERARLEALYGERAHLARSRSDSLAAELASLRERHPRRPGARAPIVPSEPPAFARQLGLAL